jgi:hypothetical protein
MADREVQAIELTEHPRKWCSDCSIDDQLAQVRAPIEATIRNGQNA